MLPPLLIVVILCYGATVAARVSSVLSLSCVIAGGMLYLYWRWIRQWDQWTEDTLARVDTELAALFERHQVPPDHGVGHARLVLGHARAMVREWWLWPHQRAAVLLAALLHDADDRKQFPDHTQYENARLLLAGAPSYLTELTLQAIALVSTAKNGDHVPKGTPLWLLIPRLADRLEAIGYVGLLRCLEYTERVGRPLFTARTARVQDEADLWATVATPERYAHYCSPTGGKSDSMLDHCYDKLLHLLRAGVDGYGRYLQAVVQGRRATMVRFVLAFGRGEISTRDHVLQFVTERK